MENFPGREWFLNQFTQNKADLTSEEKAQLRERLVAFPNQAVSIYDYTTLELRFVSGFEIFGLEDDKMSMIDVFNTANPEHRDVCGELSGKIIKYGMENIMEAHLHMLSMNYASKHTNGKDMHILFQGKIFESTEKETIKSCCTIMSYLPHLKPPKIVQWSLTGPAMKDIHDMLNKEIVSKNHISNRELEVLHFAARGKTMGEISNQLCISERTVEKHLQNLRNRYSCQNSTELVAFAKDMELI